MVGAIDHGRKGIDAGLARLEKAAGSMARDGESDDLASNLVDMMRARHEVRAGLAVVRAADETIGTLLDVIA